MLPSVAMQNTKWNIHSACIYRKNSFVIHALLAIIDKLKLSLIMYVVKLWDSLHSHLSLHIVQTHRVFINRLPLCTRVLIYANMNLKTLFNPLSPWRSELKVLLVKYPVDNLDFNKVSYSTQTPYFILHTSRYNTPQGHHQLCSGLTIDTTSTYTQDNTQLSMYILYLIVNFRVLWYSLIWITFLN